jgi:hypothetical protein
MTVRDYRDADKAAVEQLHRGMGMDYKLPDLDSPLFIVKKIYERAGKVVGAEFLKIQAEAYLMLDCELDQIEKTRVIAHLSRDVEDSAYYEHGLETIAAYIPEEISDKFSKRLNLLGWTKAREKWVTWFRELI